MSFAVLRRHAVILSGVVALACVRGETRVEPGEAGTVGSASRVPVLARSDRARWRDFDLTAETTGSKPEFVPAAYVRADGTLAVVWQGPGAPGQATVYEATNQGQSWRRTDLCSAAGANCQPWSGAVGYARSDGTDSVVYVGQIGRERHVKELTFATAQHRWQDWDLTKVAKARPIDSTPVPYVRGDRVNAVVYCQYDGDVREMWLPSGGWSEASLRKAAGGAEPAYCDVCRPAPLATANGQSMVVYLGLDRHVHALVLAGGGWSHHDLSSESQSKFAASPCPTAYQRSDGIVSVLYKVSVNGALQLRELTGSYQADKKRWAWIDWDFFSSTTPTPPPMQDCLGPLCQAGDAYGYVTPGDNTSHVMYVNRDGKIEEISFQGGRWGRTIPTPSDAARAEPAVYARPYLRKDGMPTVLYVDSGWSVHELRLE